MKKDTFHYELEYPRHRDIKFVQLGLSDVRAADGIRISYDFERDGWRIEQDKTAHDCEISESNWIEVAFVKAWQFEDKL